MHIQIVNFSLAGMTDSEYLKACDEQFGPAFAAVPGLISKVWLRNSGANIYGGVYTWRDKAAMEAFFESDLFRAVKNHPQLSNMTSTDFDVMEAPTRLTRGMAAGA